MTSTLGGWTWRLVWLGIPRLGSPFIVHAPACKRCALRLRGIRFVCFVVAMIIIVAGVWVVWPVVKPHLPAAVHPWARVVVPLACLVPWAIFRVMYASPFDMTVRRESVDYEFTSIHYAVHFAALNANADWVKINRKKMYGKPEALAEGGR